MEAFAKFKCFRRGHDFTGDWGMIIRLIILITATSFSNRQVQTAALSARRKQNLKFDCADSRHSRKQNNQYRKKEIAMESWKNAALIIIGFVLIAVSGIMGLALYKLDVGFAQIINWKNSIELSNRTLQ